MGAQERLQVLLAEQANKVCADCGARAPRYASTTFAVFLCNRCFGVHRGLGTHISKTRSVRSRTCAGHAHLCGLLRACGSGPGERTGGRAAPHVREFGLCRLVNTCDHAGLTLSLTCSLDKWTEEQLVAMERGGNAAAGRLWEALLAPAHRPAPESTEGEREEFIRNKYVRCKWMAQPSHAAAAPPSPGGRAGGCCASANAGETEQSGTCGAEPGFPLDAKHATARPEALFDFLQMDGPPRKHGGEGSWQADPQGLDSLFSPPVASCAVSSHSLAVPTSSAAPTPVGAFASVPDPFAPNPPPTSQALDPFAGTPFAPNPPPTSRIRVPTPASLACAPEHGRGPSAGLLSDAHAELEALFGPAGGARCP